MKGKELIELIQRNNLEDCTIIIQVQDTSLFGDTEEYELLNFDRTCGFFNQLAIIVADKTSI